MTVSLIIPTLNEAGSIEAVLKEIPRDVVDEVLIVDGASTDGTPEIVRRLGDRVIQQEGRGYGAAIRTGFKHVRGEIIVLADADGSYNLDDIRRLVQRVQDGADLALGSRYLPESGSEDDTLVRYVGNKAFTWALAHLGCRPFSPGARPRCSTGSTCRPRRSSSFTPERPSAPSS